MIDDVEIPPSGLVTADTAGRIVGVTTGAIRVWKARGHLDVARDADGKPRLDPGGRQLFNLMDVINTEYKLRKHARRLVVPYRQVLQ